MWVVYAGGFLSIVHKDCAPDEVLVRARRKGDIEALFPTATVVEGAGTDYRFRAVIKRAEVGRVLSEVVADIDYPNFKSAVARMGDFKLEGALHAVWHALLRLAPGGRMG